MLIHLNVPPKLGLHGVPGSAAKFYMLHGFMEPFVLCFNLSLISEILFTLTFLFTSKLSILIV